jgi:hypothetical protein
MEHLKEFNIQYEVEEFEGECRDFNKPIDEGFPIPLYHATTDKEKVCKLGLKPRCELDGKCGLGGGSTDLVSFTTDLDLAKDLAKDLETVVNIANGTINWNNYCERLNEVDQKEGMKKSPCELFEEELRKKFYLEREMSGELRRRRERQLEMLKKGYGGDSGLPITREEWLETVAFYELEGQSDEVKRVTIGDLQKRGYKVIFEDEWELVKPEHEVYQTVFYELPPDEKQEKLYDVYHLPYLWQRQFSGGRPNPVFFGIRLKKLKHLKKDDVGVVEVEGHIPTKIQHQLGGLFASQSINSLEDIEKLLKYLHRDTLFDSIGEDEEGWNYLDGLKEFRLRKSKFNKLRIRDP